MNGALRLFQGHLLVSPSSHASFLVFLRRLYSARTRPDPIQGSGLGSLANNFSFRWGKNETTSPTDVDPRTLLLLKFVRGVGIFIFSVCPSRVVGLTAQALWSQPLTADLIWCRLHCYFQIITHRNKKRCSDKFKSVFVVLLLFK